MAGSGTAHLRDKNGTPLLRVEHLVVEFPSGRSGKVHAVSDVSLDVLEGETLGLVGESGCGKSTTGRAIIQLPRPTSGAVMFEGRDLTKIKGEELRKTRRRMQLIFQDPVSSLNPRRRVRDIVAEPLVIAGEKDARRHRVNSVLETVGLDPEVSDRRPHQFSGGQCQRVSLARALIVDPKLLICDEPVSALDVSVQAQILNLLEDMKARYGLTMLFISHDLSVVKNISDRVEPLKSTELPTPINPPSGCRFRTRCPRAQDVCASDEPLMREIRPNHFVACHFPVEVPVTAA